MGYYYHEILHILLLLYILLHIILNIIIIVSIANMGTIIVLVLAVVVI